MKRVFINFMFVVTFVIALATGANAVTLNITNGTLGTIPTNQTNEFLQQPLFDVPSLSGYYGSTITLEGGSANIIVDYYGAEAGYQNSFAWGNTTLFTHGAGAVNAAGGNFEFYPTPLTTTVYNVGAGTLNFSFLYNELGSAGAVANGSANLNVANTANFFASVYGTSNNSVWLWLDDGASTSSLDNHDDLLVRLTATSVPEPTTMLLLGLGLVGLAGVGRKIKK